MVPKVLPVTLVIKEKMTFKVDDKFKNSKFNSTLQDYSFYFLE
jgi:hypothetical protein